MSVKFVQVPVAWRTSSVEGMYTDEERQKREQRREQIVEAANADLDTALAEGYEIKSSTTLEVQTGTLWVFLLHKPSPVSSAAQAAR